VSVRGRALQMITLSQCNRMCLWDVICSLMRTRLHILFTDLLCGIGSLEGQALLAYRAPRLVCAWRHEPGVGARWRRGHLFQGFHA
jgi:hypothetical protein